MSSFLDETTIDLYNMKPTRILAGATLENGQSDSNDLDSVLVARGECDTEPSILEITRLYISKSAEMSGRNLLAENCLHFYFDQISKYPNQKLNLKFIEESIEKGVDIEYLDADYVTILAKAVKLEDIDVVKALIKRNVNLKNVDKYGRNVFHFAATNKNIQVIRMIAKYLDANTLKAMLEQKTKAEQQTPTHFAAKLGSIVIAEYLIIDLHADKEARDYQERTPLYLAAEYSNKTMVKTLIEHKCCICFTNDKKTQTLNNVYGQTALYWILRKTPQYGKEALDQLYQRNQYLNKERYYLAPLEPSICKDDTDLPKSALTALVESSNFDLLIHPAVTCLIRIKWKAFGRYHAWKDFLFTVIYITCWMIFGLSGSYNRRHNYNFQDGIDVLRFVSFILGIIFTVYLIVFEIFEVINEYKYQIKMNRQRLKELEEEERNFTKGNEKLDSIREEKTLVQQNSKFYVLREYAFQIWNVYDWIAIVLLLTCIITHINDIVAHTEERAREHIRIMSFTIIFMCLRLLKVSRIIILKFGVLVMILYYVIYEMIMWFMLYVVIWLPYSCAIWIMYGGTKYAAMVNEDVGCFDQNNITNNLLNNCTTVSVSQLTTFDRTAYYMYRLTFGTLLDESSMERIDPGSVSVFIGTYIALTMVLINIFIAMLSSTFSRVYQKANAYIILQRAYEILNKEKSMSDVKRKEQVTYIRHLNVYDENKLELDLSAGFYDDMKAAFAKHDKNFRDLNNSLYNMKASLKKHVQDNSQNTLELKDDLREFKEFILNLIQKMQWIKLPKSKYIHVNAATTKATTTPVPPTSRIVPQFDTIDDEEENMNIEFNDNDGADE